MSADARTVADPRRPGVPLRPDDAVALRRAGRVSFHVRDGRACLRAHLTRAPGSEREMDLFPQRENGVSGPGPCWRVIPCDYDARGHGAGPGTGTGWRDAPALVAYASTHTDAGGGTWWPAVTDVIRGGVVLRLDWTADVQGGQLQHDGWHVDRLILHVQAPDGRTRSYLVAQTVSRDDASRMIRRDGDPHVRLSTID